MRPARMTTDQAPEKIRTIGAPCCATTARRWKGIARLEVLVKHLDDGILPVDFSLVALREDFDVFSERLHLC